MKTAWLGAASSENKLNNCFESSKQCKVKLGSWLKSTTPQHFQQVSFEGRRFNTSGCRRRLCQTARLFLLDRDCTSTVLSVTFDLSACAVPSPYYKPEVYLQQSYCFTGVRLKMERKCTHTCTSVATCTHELGQMKHFKLLFHIVVCWETTKIIIHFLKRRLTGNSRTL